MVSKSFELLSMCRLFAVFPVVRKSKKYVLSKIWLAYSILYYLGVVTSQVIILHRDFTRGEGTTFDEVLDIGNNIYRIATIFGSLFFLFQNIGTINHFESMMEEADAMMARCGRVKTFKHVNVWGWWLIIQVQVCVFSELLLRNDETGDAFFRAVDCSSFHYILTGCVLQFSTFATHLGQKLESLNHMLNEFTHSYRNYGRGKVLLRLSDVHYHLTQTATELDNVYYRTYFLLISQAVWNMTTTSYKVSVSLYKHNPHTATTDICWLVFWLILVLTVVMPCASCRQKSKHFNEELSRILIRGYLFDDPTIKERLQVHVEFDYLVKFSCGFFELDRTLIHSILGGVGSFTIILIQISEQKA